MFEKIARINELRVDGETGDFHMCSVPYILRVYSYICYYVDYYYLRRKACIKRHKLSRKYENWTMINNSRTTHYPRDISFLLLLVYIYLMNEYGYIRSIEREREREREKERKSSYISFVLYMCIYVYSQIIIYS